MSSSITAGDGLSIAALAWIALWFCAGWGLVRRLPAAGPGDSNGNGSTSHRPKTDFAELFLLAGAAGLLLAGAGLMILDVSGLGWSSFTVWALAFFAALLAAGPSWGSPRAWRKPDLSPRLDSILALSSISFFALMTAWRLNVHADYIYHWGQKAAHNYLAGGLDIAFLTRPWNAHIHPDYPNLLPILHGAAFRAAGGLGWPVTSALAVTFFALLVAAILMLTRSLDGSTWGRHVAGAVATLGTLAFTVGFRQAGGADIAMAAAMTAGAWALTLPPDRRGDLAVAWIAALVAATKLEGLPAATFLIALHVLRRFWVGESAPDGGEPARRIHRALKAGFRASGPALLVIGLWALTTWRHGLFLASNTGDFQLSRLPEVFAGLAKVLVMSDWWALPVVLLALPVLALGERQRYAALFLLAQLTFYVYSYAAGPVDTAHWIATSAARLLLHLVPAALVMVILALDRFSRIPAASDERS